MSMNKYPSPRFPLVKKLVGLDAVRKTKMSMNKYPTLNIVINIVDGWLVTEQGTQRDIC
jgi:hypothetical protein